jgi:hypothetical protein
MDQTARFTQTGAMLLVTVITFMASVAFASNDFSIDSRSVSWRGKKLKGVEVQSFETTCPPELTERKGDASFCAIDSKNVYLGRSRSPAGNKKVVEVQTLPRSPIKELGKNYFLMGRTVYFKDLGHALENADFATFEELVEETESGIDSRRQWASDHRDVYCAGQVVTGLSPKGLAFWPFLSWDCKDLVSTQVGNTLPATGYIKDSGGVFVYMDCKLHHRLQTADPGSFTVPNSLFPSRGKDDKGNFFNCGEVTSRKKKR